MKSNDNKLELDFSKTIKKKDNARKSYNIHNPINPNVNNYYQNEIQISKEEQEKILKKSHEIQRNSLILRFFAALFIVLSYYFIIFKFVIPKYGEETLIQATIGFSIYLVIAYFVRPKPDYDNLGYFGGLINKPFDYTDDWNRFLLNLKILLLPGVIVSEIIVDLLRRDY
jgi:hypothetical protein